MWVHVGVCVVMGVWVCVGVCGCECGGCVWSQVGVSVEGVCGCGWVWSQLCGCV